MKANDVAIAYVTYVEGKGGKKRPVYVIQNRNEVVSFFSITSKYQNKSDKIKELYFEIMDWKEAGLTKPSWIDTGRVREIAVDNQEVRMKKVGELTMTDLERLRTKLIERKGD